MNRGEPLVSRYIETRELLASRNKKRTFGFQALRYRGSLGFPVQIDRRTFGFYVY
jgi:hypothetical protein